MKATKDSQFKSKLQTEVKKEISDKDNQNMQKHVYHRELVVAEIKDMLKWALNQKS